MTKEGSKKGRTEESEVRKGKRKARDGEDGTEETEWKMRMEEKMIAMEETLERIEAAMKTGFGRVMSRIRELEESFESEPEKKGSETEEDDEDTEKKDGDDGDQKMVEEDEVAEVVGGGETGDDVDME